MRPTPAIDLDSAFFWQGLRQKELRLQRCEGCARHRFPPMPGCPYCGDGRCRVESVPGRGTLYSWIVVHRAFSESFGDDVPYTIGVIELDEGCRMLARLESGAGPNRIGARMAVRYVDHADWSEARFAPDTSQPQTAAAERESNRDALGSEASE